jgi:pimeloyl-ACP methyl ester carboxylesterase
MTQEDMISAGPADSKRKNEYAFCAATRVGDVAIYSVYSHPAEAGGESPRLVLVHGLGLSQRYMMPLARELASNCHVYVPDQPGFGGSGHPEHVLDMVGLADALADWTRSTGLRNAVFLGNSQGCQIIAQLAVRHPELVSAAVLQGPTVPLRSAPGCVSSFDGGRTGATTLDPWTTSPGANTGSRVTCAPCARSITPSTTALRSSCR